VILRRRNIFFVFFVHDGGARVAHGLLSAVSHVQQRKPFFTGKLGFSLMDSFVNGPNVGEATEEHPLPSTPLPAREVEVLQMLASGMSNK
jgi:DNA-binding NarL/FixJ family response regulator